MGVEGETQEGDGEWQRARAEIGHYAGHLQSGL